MLTVLCLSACHSWQIYDPTGQDDSSVIKGQETSWREMTLEEVLTNHPLAFKGTCLEEAKEVPELLKLLGR